MPDSQQPALDSRFIHAVQSEAEQLAREIRQAARASAGSEAQLIMAFDRLLTAFAERAGIRWEPAGERRVVWQKEEATGQGWIDRLFNRVVVEFKSPASLFPSNEARTNRVALTQVRQYMDALVHDEHWERGSLAGVITDGLRFIFCRYSAGQWVEEAPVDTTTPTVARFLRLLLTFRRPPLLPDPLVARFGADSTITIETVRALYQAVTNPSQPITSAVFGQWQDFFADIAGLDPETLSDKKELMVFARHVVGHGDVSPAELLFALYTFSALFIKLLVVAAVTPFFDPTNPDRLADWAMLPDEELRARLQDVEKGTFFASIVKNLTEGDFFGWYCEEWTPTLATQVKRLLSELSQFDPSAVEQAPERVRDLLKRLYHGLFPRSVRHDLGEYYTPDWLAERVLQQVDPDLFWQASPALSREGATAERQEVANRVRRRLTDVRFLDPACGSGTFPVLVIRRLRQWARECGISERDVLLPAIMKNVVGFDLNPLAVISARANVLLAVADLLRPGDTPMEIPVFLADSIVLPAEGHTEILVNWPSGVYELPLRGVGQVFAVPTALANQGDLSTLAALLRQDVELGVGSDAFLRACEGRFALPSQAWEQCKPVLRMLYKTLAQLHVEGRNGLWADIARNMFMPIFIKPADYVVGNPPWVNWESLPPHYRERSKEMWQRYGLFVHSGMDTILGKGKKDISTLMTYVAADRYLKPGGKLGFVITQSVFKTSGAGQGFRRFRLGQSGAHLRVLQVDDFSAIQPFEGATNNTAILVMQKGQPTTYDPPVPYTVWRKAGSASVPFTATWEQARPMLTARQVYAEPVDAADPTSAWLTTTRPALRALRKVLGQSAYAAHAGAYSGGANAVYWLQLTGSNPDGTVQVRNISEGAKREAPSGQHNLEPDLLFPLVRAREVRKWSVERMPDVFILVTQDPSSQRGIPPPRMEAQYPRTLAYLSTFRAVLAARKSQAVRRLATEAFYAMFAVGEYTFAPYKVVWPRIARGICAAVAGPVNGSPLIPQETVSLVACEAADEAHYVCALLNSSPFDFAVRSYSQEGGKGFGSPQVLKNVAVPAYDDGSAVHRQLGALSVRAHALTVGHATGSLVEVEREIDQLAAQVWGLSSTELEAIQRALKDVEGRWSSQAATSAGQRRLA
jgi:SAM-dependent methyltransferase